MAEETLLNPNEEAMPDAVPFDQPGYADEIMSAGDEPPAPPPNVPAGEAVAGQAQPGPRKAAIEHELFEDTEPQPQPDLPAAEEEVPPSVLNYVLEAGMTAADVKAVGYGRAIQLASAILDRRAAADDRRRTQADELDYQDAPHPRRANEFDPPPARRPAERQAESDQTFEDVAAESPAAARHLRSLQAANRELREQNQRLATQVESVLKRFEDRDRMEQAASQQRFHEALFEAVEALDGYKHILGELPPGALGPKHEKAPVNRMLLERAIAIHNRRGGAANADPGRVADSVRIAALELFGNPERSRSNGQQPQPQRREGTSPTIPSSARTTRHGRPAISDTMSRDEAERAAMQLMREIAARR